jgi:hypothetical protein
MIATYSVMVFDIIAAFIFVLLITLANKEEIVKSCKNKYLKMLWIRRIVYAVVASSLVWRIAEIVETNRAMSGVGAMLNMALVLSLLILAFARIKFKFD